MSTMKDARVGQGGGAMSNANTAPWDAMKEKVEFVRHRMTRIDEISSALRLMSDNTSNASGHRNFNSFRGAVEQLAELQDEATTGLYDTLADIEEFLSLESSKANS